MIQRIQSLLLLLAGVGLLGLFGLPFAATPQPVPATFFANSTYEVQDNPLLMVLFGLSGLLAIAGIFLFKNRPLQMRLTILAVIGAVLGGIVAVVFFLQQSQALGSAAIQDQAGLFLPPAALVFLLLAYRFIGKDEALVKSMDRLR
ncbi:MAG: DUF4293 domain-containing protein [Lewinellaceae bacterium]|nr:DUF4293 domain-containing protein [Lewinellaceae bacterium]